MSVRLYLIWMKAPTDTDNINAIVLIQDSIEDQALTEDSDAGFVDASETEHEIEASEIEFDHANDGGEWGDSVDDY